MVSWVEYEKSFITSGPGAWPGIVDRIYLGNHNALLHTKYKSCRSHGFREEDFEIFPHYKSMVAN